MNEVIATKSIARNIAKVKEDFILYEEPMSRLIFRAQIHDGGIRGKIIRQRRESKNDTWIPEKAIPINTLGKNETINLDIKTEGIKKLYLAILKLANILKQKGIEYGENEYIVVSPDRVIITDENSAEYIKKIIDAGYNDEMWKSLTESNPSLATKLSYARIQQTKKEVLNEFKDRLSDVNGFPETKDNDSWQKWIYEHNWLFGVNYKKPIEKIKININGIMPDYLFPTLDGFVDILEIKLPKDKVIMKDSNHSGSWRWSLETNTAIGQVVNYLGEMDRHRLELEEIFRTHYGYEVSFIKPRAYILIGNSQDWESDEKEGLRKMNHSLHGIEVITYDGLLSRGNQATSEENVSQIYEKKTAIDTTITNDDDIPF